MKKRNFFLLAASAIFSVSAFSSNVYPQKPITLVVPFPPGGSTDIVARVISLNLNKKFGWNVIVENKPGASGSIGLKATSSAEPDGYTIVLGQASNLITDPLFNKRKSELNNLDPIVLTSGFPMIFVVKKDSKINNFKDIIDKNNKELSVANVGNGSLPHLISLDIEKRTGTKFLHVPYKGNAPAMQDLRGGQVDVFLSSSAAAIELAKAGDIKIIASTAPKRDRFLPNVNSVSEFVDGYDAISFHGLLAPKGTSPEIINIINKKVNDILQTDEVKNAFEKQALDTGGGKPEDFSNLLNKEVKRWGDLISSVSPEGK